jgi:hypothetical protein
MANLHLLANRPSTARYSDVERLVASSTDGADARVEVLSRLDRLSGALGNELAVIEALDFRAARRPPVPPPQTLQDLVRSGRRRLEQERIGRRQIWRADRVFAVDRLRGALL